MRKDYQLEKRKYVIGGFVTLIVIIYLFRLFSLQIANDKYKESAESNAFLKRIIYPARGLVYDRTGKLIVFNKPAYDIMLIPKDVAPFDTLQFCSILGITPAELNEKWKDMKNLSKNPGYSAYTPQKLISHLSEEDYGKLQERLSLFPGFFIQKRNVREYSYPVAANVLGNIREVSATDIEKDRYYRRGDYTGDLGIEKSYELALRGDKGMEILMKDALGRVKGKYDNGMHDVTPKAGHNLKLSLDIELQQYGEQLMRNKIGAIVAIEPQTGEILALVTAPNYDPALLVGKQRGNNYAALVRDKYKPLYDRSIQGAYPPGSTFKPTQGLIFLQEGVISPSTMYPCYHGYVNRIKVGCHGHGSPIALKPALQTSCNAYFCWGFKNMIDKHGTKPSSQFEKWKNYIVEMGYGYRLGVDLPSESRGFIPNSEFYSKSFRGRNWTANSIISVSIGQGEIMATPLQIANLAATIANRGYFYTPHVVKEISDSTIDQKYKARHVPHIRRAHYDQIAEGMRMAVLGGTCKAAVIPGVEVAGKTGTAQNPHGKDHSAFIGFAPYNKPKIAICVYVENAGFGAAYGVPIGTLMMEKYLNGEIGSAHKGLEERMMNSNTIVSSGVKKH